MSTNESKETRERPDAHAMTDLWIQGQMKRKDPADGKSRRDVYDLIQKGLILRLTPTRAATWYASYQVRGTGKPTMERLGSYPNISLADARVRASKCKDHARDGQDPKAIKAEALAKEKAERAQGADAVARNTFTTVVAAYLERKAKNRSVGETKRTFELYFADWSDLDIRTIKRADIEARLTKIEHREIRGPKGKRVGGPIARETAMRQLRAMMRWHEIAEKDQSGYTPPIFRELTKRSTDDIARERFLEDEEICALWEATKNWDKAEGGSQFSSIVRLLLLSGQRRSEIADMTRDEFDAKGVWTLGKERSKNKTIHRLPFTPLMFDIVQAQPRIVNREKKESRFVFGSEFDSGYSGFSKSKATLDRDMLAVLKKRAEERGEDPSEVQMTPWVLHDLRRTAKTLSERAEINSVYIERVLNHRQKGIEATYNRYQYLPQKAEALALLEAEIMTIVTPPTPDVPADNVTDIAEAKTKRARGKR